MKQITIESKHKSRSSVLIGESLGNLSSHLPDKNVILLVDENVERIYGRQLPHYPIVKVPCGEGIKVLSTVEHLADQLLALHADRSTFLVGVGGGITCDITGFLASIFMRGVRFNLVSTTLLSQLDASIGGKNGVNLHGYKNMLGVFNQPEFVICDPHMLATLPKREFAAGLAELVKAALITDKSLFKLIEERRHEITPQNTELLAELVYRGVEIKACIVRKDEREVGERRKLNLGHTFAHAIEKQGELSHGEAVSVGLTIAAGISRKLGLLTEGEELRIRQLLADLGLPTSTAIAKSMLLEAITKDKKKQGDGVHFILMTGIGKCEVRRLTFPELKELL